MGIKNYIAIGVLVLFLIIAGAYYFFFHDSSESAVEYKPQQTQLYLIDESKNDLLNVLVSTLPEFAVKLADEKFRNLWQAQAAERKNLIETDVINAKKNTKLEVQTNYDEKNKQVIFTPVIENSLKPGMYRLSVKIKTYTGEFQTITQDFTWGVLALNTNKARYSTGETVKIGMAVLDDFGRTKCVIENAMKLNTARVWLTVTSPSGKVRTYSTEDKTITGSKECSDRNYTNKPDFFTTTTSEEEGKYMLHMEAETTRGKRSIDDAFIVQKEAPVYDIERTSYPTRIYPRFYYPVVIRVIAHKDYSGVVRDVVPGSFDISHVSDYGRVVDHGEFKTIEWRVDWKKDDSHLLQYTIKFPPITPEFYIIGPFRIGDYAEAKGWQVASDSLFSLVQEAHNTAASGTSVTATFSSAAISGHLLVLICSRDTNNAWSTPGGWSRRYRVTSAPRVYHFDRIAPASLTSQACTTTTNSGEIAAQLLEFSGNSTSGYFDKVATSTHNSGTCNTGAHSETSNNLTPTNPDELLVSGAASTVGSLTATSHNTITGASSTGFTDTDINGGSDGFSGGAASYANGWGEAVNNPPTVQHEVVTWSAAAGTCSSDIAAYNASITLSQGGFRFFDNVDNVTPGGTLAAEDTDITLNQPNYPFRLRILIDVDSPSGTTLAVDSADLILQYAILPTSGNCGDATTWAQVTNAVSANDPPIAFNPNASVAEGANISATGNDPTDNPPYTTVLQSYYGDDNNAGTPPDISNHQNTLGNNQAGLWDLSLIDNTDDSSSQTYCLRIADSSGAELSAYNQYPKVTTIITDVTIRGGSNILGGTNIQ